jgi:hypothetical protein
MSAKARPTSTGDGGKQTVEGEKKQEKSVVIELLVVCQVGVPLHKIKLFQNCVKIHALITLIVGITTHASE